MIHHLPAPYITANDLDQPKHVYNAVWRNGPRLVQRSATIDGHDLPDTARRSVRLVLPRGY